MSTLTRFNLAIRAVMEIGVVAGFAYWGVQTGESTVAKLLLGIGAPLIGFGIWGTLDFRSRGQHAEPLRLIEELVISGLAALALYAADQVALAAALAGASLVHHLLVYATGDRLLKPVTPGAGREPA